MDLLDLIIITALLLLLQLLLLWLFLVVLFLFNFSLDFRLDKEKKANHRRFLLLFSTFDLLMLFQLKTTAFTTVGGGSGEIRWLLLQAERDADMHNTSTERRKHTQAKLWTLTPIFFALSSLNQTECFTWAALFSRISIYFCFVLLKSHFRLEERKNMTPLWHWIPSIFFLCFSLRFQQFSMVIHCHSQMNHYELQ